MRAVSGARSCLAQMPTLNNGFRRIDMRPLLLACGFLFAAMTVTLPLFAQSDASEHASHHPTGASPPVTPSTNADASQTMTAGQQPSLQLPKPAPDTPNSQAATPVPAGMPPDGMTAMGKMMEGMMGGMGQECCGGAAGNELYPLMMGMPSMTPEQRVQVQRLSAARIGEGKALVQLGQQRLFGAITSGDHKIASEAMQQLRDGLGRIDSGAAAHRVLAEGTSPQSTALRWFKGEMDLGQVENPESGMALERFSLMHMIAMALLVAFAIAMIAMYFFKMRRTAALFGRIDAGSGKPPPGAAPALGGAPLPSGSNRPDFGTLPVAQGTETQTKGPVHTAHRDAGSPSTDTLPSIPDAKWHGLLRVMNVITETPTVKTVRLGPAADAAALPFTFLPGQFLNVTFSIGGARMNRSYSISSSPTQRAYLDLTVKREPRGAVSRHIADLLKVGDELEAGGPVGRFTFTGTEANSIVLISGGVGITPMMSISRYLSEQSWPNDIFFIYACRSPADFIFAKEIAELERHNPWLHVTVVMEHPDGTDWQGLTGRLNTDVLSQAVPHIASRRIHMCGPPVMMEAVRSLLQELKVPAEQIKTEDFGTAAPPPGEGSNRFAAAATGPLVSFSKSSKSAKIHLDQTLLELSEELNIGIEFSCRVGTCGICKVQLTAGEVDMAIDDALDADDKVKGIVLACQAKPKGPVTVEA
ncbi:2Fe-2S iron-sulfur cluster-binding protein [Pseudoduganella umbonata]|nr:2Fe-2S iron-sulfur cluster-binding protein [Pseudoduganella umbonata]